MVALENLAVFTVEIINEKKKGWLSYSPIFRNITNPKLSFVPRHVGMTPFNPC